MTSLLDARDALDAAFVAGGIAIADAPGGTAAPYGVIFGEGVGGGPGVMPGQVRASFRVTLIAGGWDKAVAGRQLTTMVQTAMTTVRALSDWQFVEVRRDNIIVTAGGSMLGCDVIASRLVDI